MAKKVRRARLSATQTYIPSEAAPEGATAAPAPSAPARREVNFAEEYRYLIADLRRVGILAAVILSGLVVLSFFLK